MQNKNDTVTAPKSVPIHLKRRQILLSHGGQFYTLCLANNNKCESEKKSHIGQIELIQLCNTSPLKDKVIVY